MKNITVANKVLSQYTSKLRWYITNCIDITCSQCSYFKKGCTKSGYPGLIYTPEVLQAISTGKGGRRRA
jgi:hypothetical protein